MIKGDKVGWKFVWLAVFIFFGILLCVNTACGDESDGSYDLRDTMPYLNEEEWNDIYDPYQEYFEGLDELRELYEYENYGESPYPEEPF